MKLNHLDLQVADVIQHVDFFERFLGFEMRSNRSSPAVAIMDDGHGFTLVLQRREDVVYPEDFHIGFIVDDVAVVETFHAKARSEGLDISDIQKNNRGTMTYCRAPGGFLVEVNAR